MFPWWKLSREVNDGERPAYRFGEVRGCLYLPRISLRFNDLHENR